MTRAEEIDPGASQWISEPIPEQMTSPLPAVPHPIDASIFVTGRWGTIRGSDQPQFNAFQHSAGTVPDTEFGEDR
jgi:hypothetical protein